MFVVYSLKRTEIVCLMTKKKTVEMLVLLLLIK